jgi:VWFA-related protein
MRRTILLVLALLLATTLPAVAQSSAITRVTQVDSSRYPDVTVYVSVTDGGKSVGGLTERDFTLTEDGQPVTLSGFVGGGASPVTSMLVLDRSGSMAEEDKIADAQDAARAFVDLMRPGDRTGLITFSSESRTAQDFTASRNDLAEAIGRIRPDGGTALYDSVVAGVDALEHAEGRRALVVLTDGQDCRESSSCPRSSGSRHSLQEAIDYANAKGQPLYMIGLGQRGSADRDGVDEAVLGRLGRDTGGDYFYAPSGEQLAGLYRTLSAGLQQEYALTYRSPRPFYDGTRRDIRVSVGGAPATAGGYVERHLINVHSDPFVGLLLLIPILGALLLPTLRHKRLNPADVEPAAQSPATGATLFQPASVVVIPPDVTRCTTCDAPLLRAGARFCAECGASQEASPAATPRRVFCDQCGRPMRSASHFCSHCGATAPTPASLEVSAQAQ